MKSNFRIVVIYEFSLTYQYCTVLFQIPALAIVKETLETEMELN